MQDYLYIDLMKKVLTDYNTSEKEEYRHIKDFKKNWKMQALFYMDRILRKKQFTICKYFTSTYEMRLEGKDWPARADTMIGMKRLENIEFCFNEVIKNNIPGDFIETGVWRGGAAIFMKALLKSCNITDRIVWAADSFEGLPKPDNKYAEDKDDKHYEFKELSISLDEVKSNFDKYGLLDDKVQFLKGWFKDTLPVAPVNQLSIVRLDGDMYESTMDGLVNLYPKLSEGGFIIIDDWGTVPGAKKATEDYRKQHNIMDEIIPIDWTGVFWKKSK